MTLQFRNIYLLFAVVFCLTGFVEQFPFSWFIKILPMLMLLGLVIVQRKLQPNPLFKWLIAALIFSIGGDVFLALDRNNYFIFGLSSFLISHLFYIQTLRPLSAPKVKLLVPYVVYAGVVFSLMTANLGEMLIPVFLYLSVILMMSVATKISVMSNRYLIMGGLSFIVSDSIIGLDKFFTPIPMAGILIMTTYYFAQYQLVKGFLVYSKKTDS